MKEQHRQERERGADVETDVWILRARVFTLHCPSVTKRSWMNDRPQSSTSSSSCLFACFQSSSVPPQDWVMLNVWFSFAGSAVGMILTRRELYIQLRGNPKTQVCRRKNSSESCIILESEEKRRFVMSKAYITQIRAELEVLAPCAAADTLKQTDALSLSSSVPLLPPLTFPSPLSPSLPLCVQLFLTYFPSPLEVLIT